MKYRAEIDGLRALAVVPVILFHAGFEHFSGGFVGVDIFFVISGYLITTIILSEKEKGTFSLVNFYDRRARRILPALFFVMIVSIPFACLWLFPADMKDFSQSLVAVSLFSSNILFWQETGYWEVGNELKPLLHTWSLAVEEQYYVLFPLFLMLMWKFRKRWILSSLLIIAIISLLMSQWGAYNAPTANFFLLPTRGWELAIGASIAFYFLYRKQAIRALLSHKVIDEIMGFIGLLLISYSVLTFDESVPFPSFYALIPTLGTGLIILFSSSQTLVGRLLGSKPLVGIGLISYSAYLWHQPLFAFARHRSLAEPDSLFFIILFFVTFVFAYLSWRYVEKPFRRKNLVSSKVVLIFWLLGSALFIGFGSVGHLTNGHFFKKQLAENNIEMNLRHNYGLSKTCNELSDFPPECSTSKDPEVLIWGDSYAMQLVSGVIASNDDSRIVQMTKSVCGPFFDIAPITTNPVYAHNWAKGCLEFTEKVRDWIKVNKTVKYVVVSSHFNNYLSKNNKLLYRNGHIENSNVDTISKEFDKTLIELKSLGVIPIVFSSTPANGNDLGRCLAKASVIGLNLDKCDFDVEQMTQDRIGEYNFLREIEKSHTVIRLDKLMCDNQRCKTHLGSTWLFRDKGHLSYKGSAELGEKYGFYDLIVGAN